MIRIELGIEIKPTNAKCLCEECSKSIKKGRSRFIIKASGFQSTGSKSWHSKCFFRAIFDALKEHQIINNLVASEIKGDKFIKGFRFAFNLIDKHENS